MFRTTVSAVRTAAIVLPWRIAMVVLVGLSLLLVAAVSYFANVAQAQGARQVCVGNTCSYTTLQSAFNAASNGSTIIIAGEWTEGASLSADNVRIRGVNNAHLRGGAVQGKAGLVIKGNNTTVENLECSDMRVPDKNGACIRQEGKGLTLRNVHFRDSENGLLASSNVGHILIEDSTFERNGKGEYGRTHNIYVNGGDTELTIRRSKFLEAHNAGHEIKSRARRTTIENSVIASLNSTNSRNIDISNGGVVIIRNNVIEQGPKSQNNQSIGIGLEGIQHTTNSILIENNYIILERDGTNVLLNSSGMPSPTFRNNTIIGGSDPGGSGNKIYANRSAAGISAYPFLPNVSGGSGATGAQDDDESDNSGGGSGSDNNDDSSSTPPSTTTPGTPSSATDCHAYRSGDPVLAGFGVPWNPFSSARELIMKVTCTTSGKVTVGNGSNTLYIYRYGYESYGGAWKRITFQGANRTGDWLIGNGTATLSSLEGYVAAYTCQLIGGQWKCGCRDQACVTPSWQLQIYGDMGNASPF